MKDTGRKKRRNQRRTPPPMIYEVLGKGQAAAKTCNEIAKLLNLSARQVTAAIQKERAGGKPICAATGINPGYYIPETAADMIQYCKQLKHREMEIERTRRACSRFIKTLSG